MSSYHDRVVREAIEFLTADGTKVPMGVSHWDAFIKAHANAGTVRIPVQFGHWQSTSAFYYVLESVGSKRMVYFRQLTDQPARFGDCYGFFGFHDFAGFRLGTPIMIVEGIVDWWQAKRFYPHVLATFHVGLSQYQWHVLYSMTRKLIVGFDRDSAGATGTRRVVGQAAEMGMKTKVVVPVHKDFGEYTDAPDAEYLIERHKSVLAKAEW